MYHHVPTTPEGTHTSQQRRTNTHRHNDNPETRETSVREHKAVLPARRLAAAGRDYQSENKVLKGREWKVVSLKHS